MYRIIVVSDTHRHLDYIIRVLDNIQQFDMIIHLGDNTEDARRLRKTYPDAKVLFVQGNTDFISPDAPIEIFTRIEDVPVFMTHGHMYGVKSTTDNIYYRGKELGASVVMFGHTHIPLCEENEGMWLLNPGGHNSIKRNIGIIEIENGGAKCCLYPC